jgi:hypothetical protein
MMKSSSFVAQAVAISSGMDYAIVEQPGNDRLLVVGCDRLEPLKELLGELKVLTTFGGESRSACGEVSIRVLIENTCR